MDKTLGLCRSTEDFGKGISMLALRLFAAYEFGEAGLAKWRGENWFADIRDAFPFPFGLLPAGLSWNLAMGAELVVPVLLVLGLLTPLFTCCCSCPCCCRARESIRWITCFSAKNSFQAV